MNSGVLLTRTAILCCCLLGLFYISRITPAADMLPAEDSATYMLLARSLGEGKGLRSLWVEGQPAHAKAPGGYPAMLAGVAAVWGEDLFVYAVATAVVSGLAFGAVFLFFRREESDRVALGLMVLSAANGVLYLYGRSVLSELPYLLWSLLGLMTARRCLARAAPSWNDIVLLAGTLSAAFLTRTVGAVLVVAVVLVWALAPHTAETRTRDRRMAWALGAVLLLVVGWGIRQGLVSAGTRVSYWHDFIGGNYGVSWALPGFLRRCAEGAYALAFYAVPKALLNVPVSGRSWPLFLVSAVTGIGLLRALAIRRRTLDIYVAGTLLLACAWPWVPVSGVRYMAPLVPFLIYYFYLGVEDVLGWTVPAPVLPRVRAGVLGLLLLGYLGHSPVWRRGAPLPPDPLLRGPCAWIREHTPPDAVVVSWMPVSLYLVTGRRSPDMATSTFNAAQFERLLSEQRSLYVFNDISYEQSRGIFRPVYFRHSRRFRLVYAHGPYRIYHVSPDPARTGEGVPGAGANRDRKVP